jgi:3-phosphoshikimate 1-carboxyvinyltransferase
MSLPDIIEMVPLERSVCAEIVVPGSKSITNRALILAALGQGETRLEGALWSEDTQVMVEALGVLGFETQVESDPRETGNRFITVKGLGGTVPQAGTKDRPLELFVGNAGTAARFLAALVCLGRGVYRLHGVARMHDRPQAALFEALRALGYQVESPNDRLPATIHGTGPRPGRCRVSVEESSQFASGLLLCAPAGGWQVEVVGENAEESFYVSMTAKLVQRFPGQGGTFQIEPDASSGSYFIAADRLAPGFAGIETRPRQGVRVVGWPASGLQIDERFPSVLQAGRPEISRLRDLGDSLMTAVVLAPFGAEPVRFTDLGRLRVQECERVMALRAELTRCGGKVLERGDTLEVFPARLHGATIETYEDHRMAMCFAILGLKVPGIRIKNPSCVKKTFPNFFQKLAGSAPAGLGLTIRNGSNGGILGQQDLFAQ